MENEFHLSIKNQQRKIGDVRDLFRNLTNYEKACLEKEKVLSEQKISLLRRQRELEELKQQELEEQRRSFQNFSNNKKNYQINFNRYYSFGNSNRMSEGNEYTNYEEKVMKVYDRLNREASEDFGKYLDEDDEYDNNNHNRNGNFNENVIKKSASVKETDDNKEPDGRKGLAKKLRKLSFKKKGEKNDAVLTSSSASAALAKQPDSAPDQQQQQQPHLTDMCGFYTVDLPPKEKERLDKIKQDQSKGGLFGLKNKIKQLFTNDEYEDYNFENQPNTRYYEEVTDTGADPDIQKHFFPRTIQDIQFASSKIGYQVGQTYNDYYSQVDDLRRFDEEARIKNVKIRPNDNIAIMDDEFNLKYTKVNKFIEPANEINYNHHNYENYDATNEVQTKNKKSKNKEKNKEKEKEKDSNDAPSTKKQNKLLHNKLTEAIISKAKSLRT